MFRAKDKKGKRQDWGSYVPDRVAGINYSETYREHDWNYMSYSSKTRWDADVEMLQEMLADGSTTAQLNRFKGKKFTAVGQTLWSPVWATINFIGVRLMGWLFYKG